MRTLKHRAFTLVELVMVIVIIGLLAAVITPQFTSMQGDAEAAAEKASVAAIRTGIKMVRMSNLAQGNSAFPTTLDAAATGAASEANPLFTTVVEGGITDANWEKRSKYNYRYKPTTIIYIYDRTTGNFKPQ